MDYVTQSAARGGCGASNRTAVIAPRNSIVIRPIVAPAAKRPVCLRRRRLDVIWEERPAATPPAGLQET